MKSIVLLIRQKRKEFHLTQEDLVDRAGVGVRFIRNIEQGKESMRTDKLNQVLLLFGHELAAVPIQKVNDL